MSDDVFEINTPGIDVTQVVARIQATVAEKRAQGLYADARVARAERTNLASLRNEDGFLSFYLESLRDAVFVDINDFAIVEQRARFTRLLVAFKRLLWKMLKFYTYRLWSQQNQVNGLILSAVDAVEARHREKLEKLEARVAELEARVAVPK